MLLLALMVDVSVIPMIPVAALQQYAPLTSLVTVAVLGLLFGRTRGLMYGLIGGVLFDVLVGSRFGLMASIYIACGFIGGFAIRRFPNHFITPFAAQLVCYTLYELVMMLYQYLSNLPIHGQLWLDALVRVLISFAVGQLIYFGYNKLLRPAWVRYSSKR